MRVVFVIMLAPIVIVLLKGPRISGLPVFERATEDPHRWVRETAKHLWLENLMATPGLVALRERRRLKRRINAWTGREIFVDPQKNGGL